MTAFANGVRAARSTRANATASTTNSPITTIAPMRPSSSPMIAKMKSLSAAGSHDHFAVELPRPTPKMPPFASANRPCWICQQSSLSNCVQFSCRNAVMRRIRLSLETATITKTRRAEQHRRQQQPEAHADEEEGAEQHPAHDHHGAEVAAEEDETDGDAADQEDGQDATTEVVEQRLLLRDDEPEPDDERDLDELRRLELHRTDRQPVGVAADGDAERRGDDEELEDAGDDEQGPGDRIHIRSGMRLEMSMMGTPNSA